MNKSIFNGFNPSENDKPIKRIVNPVNFSEIEVQNPLKNIPQGFLKTTNPAKHTYERLIEYIKNFEKDLDDEHEIGAYLVSFNQSTTFHITNLGYYGPDIISFGGINENGDYLQLIQNICQLNVLLVGLKKLHDKPNKIGFAVPGSHDKVDDTTKETEIL